MGDGGEGDGEEGRKVVGVGTSGGQQDDHDKLNERQSRLQRSIDQCELPRPQDVIRSKPTKESRSGEGQEGG